MSIIVFEGLPGSGKTTLIKRISKKFNQPYIFELIDKDEAELRPEESEKEGIDYFLKNDLKKYTWAYRLSKNNLFVLVDRGAFSTFAYNSCGGEKKNLRKAKENLNKINKEFDKKVVYIYIKINPAVSLSRKKARENKNNLWSFEKNLKKIGEIYDKIFEEKANVIIIDGSKSLSMVQTEIETMLNKLTH